MRGEDGRTMQRAATVTKRPLSVAARQQTEKSMTTRFAILGSGAWGTAIAMILAQNPQHRVALWSARPESAASWHARRENVRLLPGVAIPQSILLTTDIREAV